MTLQLQILNESYFNIKKNPRFSYNRDNLAKIGNREGGKNSASKFCNVVQWLLKTKASDEDF